MKKIFEFILISIIVGFCFSGTYIFFIRAFTNTDAVQFNTLQGAFLGAFFAFIFIRIADGLVKINNRKSKARNALIRFQHLFNYYLSSSHDSVFLIDNLMAMIDASNNDDTTPHIWTSRFAQVSIDRELIVDLDNIMLINEIMTLNDDLRKINQSLETINRTYNSISSTFLDNNIDIMSYTINLKSMKEQCLEIRNFIENTKEELIRLLAITGMLSKNDTALGKLIKLLVLSDSYPNYIVDNLDNEIIKVKNDIETNAEKSQEKINRTPIETN